MRILLSAALAALTTLVVVSPATAATYVIDPDESSLTWGFFATLTWDPTSPGSNTTKYSGTIDASVPVGGGAITFNGASIIGLEGEAATYLPAFGVPSDPLTLDQINADGSFDPTGVGDGEWSVGVNNHSLSILFNAGTVVLRDLEFTLNGSGTTDDADNSTWSAEVANGWFSADTNAVGVSNTENILTTLSLGNAVSGVIGYTLVGSTETITIPFNFDYDAGGPNSFRGQIVATRVIPEPTSGLFLAGLAIGAGAVVRRRRK